MKYIIIAIVFLTLLLSLMIWNDVKNNRLEKLKLCKSILGDMLIVLILFFMMTGRESLNNLTIFVNNIKSNQIENISIIKNIQTIVKELKEKNIVFVDKINDFNNTLDEANKQLNNSLYKQQIISDKIDDIKQKLEDKEQNTKSKIIWVGE